jgi:hypothetical protein
MKGRFKARAKAGQWGLGESNAGNEQIAVVFDILTEGAEYSNLTWYGSFSDGAVERTITSLRYMGWESNDLEKLEGLDKNEVELVVEEEEYEGKTRTKVAWVNRAGALNLKAPLSAERTKSFAAAMRDRIKAIDAAKGQKTAAKSTGPKPPAGPPEPPPVTDADIPF